MIQTRQIMGMPVTVKIIDGAEAVFDIIFEYFEHVDEVFSTFKPESEISRLNRAEIKHDQLSAEVKDVLAACQRMKLRSQGYFDIERNGKVDPSGLVKGWAVWNAAQIIEQAGSKNYFVDAGGDIQAGGANEQGSPWSVGLRHPTLREKIVKTLLISNGAVATSGIYERGQHIYDPHTGKSVASLLALTVVGPNIEDADVVATAAFAMGASKALDFVSSQGLEGYMITPDHNAHYTAGFERYIKN